MKPRIGDLYIETTHLGALVSIGAVSRLGVKSSNFKVPLIEVTILVFLYRTPNASPFYADPDSPTTRRSYHILHSPDYAADRRAVVRNMWPR